ncbi:MAG: GNAT family N-acetyltransferase [Armatimonadota bacterium]
MVDPVEDLTDEGLEHAVAVLGRAFATDPMYAAFFPNPTTRAAGIDALNRAVLRMALRHGDVRVAGQGNAVAVWMRPGAPVRPISMIAAGVLGAARAVGVRDFVGFVAMDGTIEALRRRSAAGRHRHLLILAVDPARQRSGLGKALLADGLARAERERVATWLETSVEANLGYYRGHGFEVAGTGTLGATRTPFWGMQRRPRDPAPNPANDSRAGRGTAV